MMRTKRVPVDEHLLSDRLTDYDKKMGRASSSTSLHSIGSSEQASELFNLKEHNEALEQAFPRVVPEPVLIDHVAEVIEKHGFTGSTAINLVSCCRDELCRPFTEYLDNKWGLPSFNIASLAGMVFCGRTGFKAAMAHAPVVDGKERYVFWVAPHVAFSGNNEVGKVWRPGRAKASTACGALLALLGEIKNGRVNLTLDPNDMEMSLLKQQIMSHLDYGNEPSLVELTYAVHDCILSDVRRTAEAAVNLDTAEYIIVSGIQVHAGFSKTMFWPGSITKYTSEGETNLYEEYAECVSQWRADSAEFLEMEELLALQNKQRICRLAASTGDTQLLKAVASATPLNKVLDHKRLTLLHVASRDGQTDVVKLLLDTVIPGDADFLDATDNDQLTAIDHAVEQRHDDIAELLMDRGAGLEGGWLKDRLVEVVTSGEVKELQRLMWFAKDISVAVRSTDQDGRSLVHIAMQHKGAPRNELLEMLLAFGADLNEVDFYGNDAVSVAVASVDSDPELEAILAKSADLARVASAAVPTSPFLKNLRGTSPTGCVPPLSLETSA